VKHWKRKGERGIERERGGGKREKDTGVNKPRILGEKKEFLVYFAAGLWE